MSIACKLFPNATSARAAMNAVKASWVKPALVFVNCAKPSILATTNAALVLCTDAVELISGQWALIANHPGWKSDTIEEADILRPATPALDAAAPKGKT
jgi:hypothetical protein